MDMHWTSRLRDGRRGAEARNGARDARARDARRRLGLILGEFHARGRVWEVGGDVGGVVGATASTRTTRRGGGREAAARGCESRATRAIAA